MTEKINTMLYGEKPVRVEFVFCDKHDKCDFFQNGTCLNVTQPFSQRCKFGSVESVNGCSPRAAKYHSFCSKHRSDEKYGALQHPTHGWGLAVIDGFILLNLIWLVVEKKQWDQFNHEWIETEDYRINDNGFSTGKISYIPVEDFSPELLNRVCKSTAMAMMGGEITDYKSKVIPNILFECRKKLPNIWAEFVKTYPEYSKVLPNHVGRYAFLKTLSRECTYQDCHGNVFEWDGEWLVCKNYTRGFTPFGCKKDVECRFKPGEEKYKITRNAEVVENTVFV